MFFQKKTLKSFFSRKKTVAYFFLAVAAFCVGVWVGCVLQKKRAPMKTQHVSQDLMRAVQQVFDAGFYKKTYLKNSTQDPFTFYMNRGFKDLHNPSPHFDAAFYERMYLKTPDGYLRGARQNPLVHYIQKGKKEGFLTHPKLIKKATPLQNAKHYLCLTAIFRDEARFLKEWIEYYRMMGVEHFYLTNHLSKDNYMEVLNPYIDAGIVTLRDDFEVPDHARHKTWKAIQNRAYKWALEDCRFKTEWLLMIDTDEFVVPLENETLVAFLKNYDDCAAVAVHWKVFGTGNVKEVKRDELLLEKLVRCVDSKATLGWWVKKELIGSSAHYYLKNKSVKSFVKPRYTKGIPDCHYAHLKEGYVAFNTAKKPCPPSWAYTDHCYSKARVHHYVMRDLKFFKERKLKRHGKYTNEQGAFTRCLLKLDKLLSAKKDTTALRFVPALKKRIFSSTLVP